MQHPAGLMTAVDGLPVRWILRLAAGVILPALFRWDLNQNNPSFLTFLIVTHLATAIVLFLFFLKDWIEIFKGLGRSVRDRKISAGDTYAKLGWLLIAGTVPAGILGLVLEKPIRGLFASPLLASAFLVVNGLVLFAAEALRRRKETPAPASAQIAAAQGSRLAAATLDVATEDSRQTGFTDATDSPDSACPDCPGNRRSASAPPRPRHCCRGSPGPDPRWSAACSPGSPMSTPPGSASSSQPSSSVPQQS